MALILGRHVGEQIHIGPDITITVIHLSPSIVRLQIDAPRELRIIRGEHAAAAKALADDVERLTHELEGEKP